MEYVDGESLANRLAKGPLPLAKVLEYGRQIADALDKAHARGIVHRDLKPANVMLTKSGAKLLDFGLARGGTATGVGTDGTQFVTAPSPSTGLTAQGTLIGTWRYMAPEQLEGHDADPRSDIWTLGCLLHEMLSGRPAFDGRTQASLIAAILAHDPDVPGPSTLPPALGHVIRRCLAKAPDDRWQSAADVRHELAWIADASGTPSSMFAASGGARRWVAWTVAAAASVALAITAFTRTRSDVPKRLMRFSLGLPEEFRVPGYLSISHDGQKIAFVTDNPKRDAQIIWIRSIDAVEPRPLVGTEGYRQQPFWSPDGKSVGFFADHKLKRIDLATGIVQVICEAELGSGGTWGPDGTIVFAPNRFTPLYRVASTGGTPGPLTQLASSPAEQSHRLPNFLPDGRHFVFTILGADGWYGLGVGSTASAQKVELTKWPADLRDPYESTQAAVTGDFLLFARTGSLFAQRLDTRGWRLIGDANAIVAGVDEEDLGRQAFAVSENGTVVYRARSSVDDIWQLAWVSRTGQPKASVWEPGRIGSVSVSPDGRRAAVAREDTRTNTSDIWVVELSDGHGSRLTEGKYADSPLWSADGSRIFFTVVRTFGVQHLHSVLADGSRPETLVNDSAFALRPIGWDIDGSLMFTGFETVAHTDFRGLWSVDLSSHGRPKPVFSSDRGGLGNAALSPDGRDVAWSGSGNCTFSRSMAAHACRWPAASTSRRRHFRTGERTAESCTTSMTAS
jgi:eukaryotic-like serine/threonine-protein kinase